MESTQSKNKTRKKITTVVIFLIIFGILAYWVGIQANGWWQVRKEYIEMGYASDKFPYKMYTAEELAERGLYPESLYENVLTRTRPEETYAKFRKALVEEDFDTAAECFVIDQQQEIREGLKRVKEDGLLQKMLDDLPGKLEDIYIYNESVENRDFDKTSLTSYDYVRPNDSSRMAHVISFVKNRHGDWLIENL